MGKSSFDFRLVRMGWLNHQECKSFPDLFSCRSKQVSWYCRLSGRKPVFPSFRCSSTDGSLVKTQKKKKTGQNGATGNEIQPLTTSLLVRHKRYFPDFSSPVSATTNKTWLNYLIQNKPFICRYSDTTLLRSIPKASSQIHLKRIIQVNWCTLAG